MPADQSRGQPAPSRFIVVQDRNGRRQALAKQAVSAILETEDGLVVLLLPGGRLVELDQALDVVLEWLS